MTPTLKTRRELFEEATRRFLAAQTVITWFGGSAVSRALLLVVAGLAQYAYQTLAALFSRFTLLSAKEGMLDDVAEERGAGKRRTATHAKTYVVLQPASTTVTAITAAGPNDLLEVEDSSAFTVGNSIRIRNADGSVTEIGTITAITTATGPGGGDELQVATLAGTYSPTTEDVAVLIRVTVVAGTEFTTTVGVRFQSLDTVVTGDANPIMDGESTSLALADKAWCECTTTGVSGNVEALTVTALATAIPGVVAVFNPAPGTGGTDAETDFEYRYRASHGIGGYAQETADWAEALLREASSEMLRVVITSERSVATLNLRVLKRNGGAFSATEIAALESFAAARVRSEYNISCANLELTAIEIEGRITLLPGYTLRGVWKSACDSYASFLDYRKWQPETPVDEADLIAILKRTPGVASLETSTFLPFVDTEVGAESLPAFARLSLEDITTGDVVNADLTTRF